MTCRQGEARPASAMRQRGRLRGTVIAAWMASWMAAVFPLASPCGAGEAPVVLHVDDDAPEDGDGLTWATAITHLRDALHEARLAREAGYRVMEIRVAGGLYKPHLGTPSPLEWPKTFVLVDGTAMRGGYRGAFTGKGDPNDRDYVQFESRLSGDLLGDDGPPGSINNRTDNSNLVVLAEVSKVDVVFEAFAVTNGENEPPGVPGQQMGSAMRCVGGAPQITHSRFHDNQATDYGGLTLLRPEGASIRDCIFTFNFASRDGGGLALVPFGGEKNGVAATVGQCRFEDNRAMYGGGIWAGYGADLDVFDCTFIRNRVADEGGAMYTGATRTPLNDRITVTRCLFQDNISEDNGGAVAFQGRFDRCDFINNWAGGGGALDLRFSPGGSAVTNCRFILNRGATDGGSAIRGGGLVANCVFRLNSTFYGGVASVWPDSPAVYVNCLFDGNQNTQATPIPTGAVAIIEDGAQAAFIDCTMTNNGGANSVGGISVHGTGTAEVVNSVLWGNLGTELQGSILVSHSCIEGGWPGTGNIVADPQFVDRMGPDGLPGTDDADLRLARGSPCIDAGDTLALPIDVLDIDGDGDAAEVLPIDLLGRRRVVNDPATPNTGWPAGSPQTLVVDMGAMEYQPERVGDLDGDGNVSLDDLLFLINAWGQCPDPARCPADISPPPAQGTGGAGDGVVNVGDLLLLISNWG